jgi:threonine/homoserine/homoserine lactone efflux protein
MSLDSILPLALFAIVTAITPGGATTLATSSGARFGFRRSMPLMTGIAMAMALLAAFAAAGLASLLLAAPVLLLFMKVAGSAYLIWLAVKIGGSGAPNFTRDLGKPVNFVGGAGLLLLNPKAWTMALGGAASFATLADSPFHLALLLGSTLGIACATSLSLWCFTGFLLARLLRTERQWRRLNGALGLLLALSVLPIWLK